MSLTVLETLRGLGSLVGLPAAAICLTGWMAVQAPRQPALAPAAIVTIAAGTARFPDSGEFLRDNLPAAAPTVSVNFERGVEIMKFQVSLSDYRRCVEAGACQPADASASSMPDVPVTGVSYRDAMAYAEWYSNETGMVWRLPTDAEWVHAAAERFVGDLGSAADDPKNPALAWLRRYRQEAELSRGLDPRPQSAGSFGPNSNGVADLAGNVWEWTSSCYVRSTLAADGSIVRSIDNCGVHIVEGRHRTYMSNFIRDGRSGGCAVGTPPDNLGFRLVREPAATDGAPPIS